MKISLFPNNIAIWIDYSDREDCIGVFDLSPEDVYLLENGATIDIEWNITTSQAVNNSIEIKEIEKTIMEKKERYLELKELGNMRSNDEEIEFSEMEIFKNTLLGRRKEILDTK